MTIPSAPWETPATTDRRRLATMRRRLSISDANRCRPRVAIFLTSGRTVGGCRRELATQCVPDPRQGSGIRNFRGLLVVGPSIPLVDRNPMAKNRARRVPGGVRRAAQVSQIPDSRGGTRGVLPHEHDPAFYLGRKPKLISCRLIPVRSWLRRPNCQAERLHPRARARLQGRYTTRTNHSPRSRWSSRW